MKTKKLITAALTLGLGLSFGPGLVGDRTAAAAATFSVATSAVANVAVANAVVANAVVEGVTVTRLGLLLGTNSPGGGTASATLVGAAGSGQVTLTASPAPGFAFAGWALAGSLTPSGPLASNPLTVTGVGSATAQFTPYRAATGQVDRALSNGGTSEVLHGRYVTTLIATPAACFVFARWEVPATLEFIAPTTAASVTANVITPPAGTTVTATAVFTAVTTGRCAPQAAPVQLPDVMGPDVQLPGVVLPGGVIPGAGVPGPGAGGVTPSTGAPAVPVAPGVPGAVTPGVVPGTPGTGHPGAGGNLPDTTAPSGVLPGTNIPGTPGTEVGAGETGAPVPSAPSGIGITPSAPGGTPNDVPLAVTGNDGEAPDLAATGQESDAQEARHGNRLFGGNPLLIALPIIVAVGAAGTIIALRRKASPNLVSASI